MITLLCAALCCGTAVSAAAQTAGGERTPRNLYEEGERLFDRQAYSASLAPLRAFLRQTDEKGADASQTSCRMEAEYMLACAAYELEDADRLKQLADFLNRYPDAPHANRIRALVASVLFYDKDYAGALEHFDRVRFETLSVADRDDMTYRRALCSLKTGDLSQASVWFKTLQTLSPGYEADCAYYLAYIRYTQKDYDRALRGFQSLQSDAKYGLLVPYYIAEIHLAKEQCGEAAAVAERYIAAHPRQENVGEMHRVLGTARYYAGDYRQAREPFAAYRRLLPSGEMPRRDALYMEALADYRCGVFTPVPGLLGDVTGPDDALTQNAYLHMGLAYLQLADKNKARMAFEQAAASDADPGVKEQAAYNYALCIHETAFDPFGQSVGVFERFLNDYPRSPYADRISGYLVDVYLTTRSYGAALESIERIARPGTTLLKAKQRILFQIGTQQFAGGQLAESIGSFTKSIALGNLDAGTRGDALYWRGEAYYRTGQMDKAEADLNAYRSLSVGRGTQTYALAYYNLGYIAFHRKQYDLARERFLEFLRQDQEHNNDLLADACNRVGDCYLQGRYFDEAARYYTRAESMGAATGDYSYYQLALVAGLQKDYHGKVRLLGQLAERYPSSSYLADALYETGRAYVQDGDSRRAIDAFKRLVKRYPDSPVSRKAAAEIGLLYYQNGDYNRAVSAYKDVLTDYPGSEEARLALRDLKSIYVDANRVDEFARLVASLPGQVRFEASEQDSLTYVAAERQYMKGNDEAAKQSFEHYLTAYPDGAFGLNAHYNLCLLAKKRGDEEQVLTHAGSVLRYPDSPYAEEALLMHAEVLFNQKRYEEALADYRQLQARASTSERRQLGMLGTLRCAVLTEDHAEAIQAATALLGEAKLSPELRTEALYARAKARLERGEESKALPDLQLLAADTRTQEGAEAKYLLALLHYGEKDYAGAEKEILDYIERSTPHAYWLARSFVLLSDVYVAMGKDLDARQYLLSLKQNYTVDDDIQPMIEERLARLKSATGE